MSIPKHVWMVRAGNDNVLADQLWDADAVAIGWDAIGNATELTSRDACRERLRETYPEYAESKHRLSVHAGQIYRFAHEIAPGDYVISYIQASREIIIGEVISSYIYNPQIFGKHYPHLRKVVWYNRISRDLLSEKAGNSTGSTLTVFNLDDYTDEFYRHAISISEPLGDGLMDLLSTEQLQAILTYTTISPGQINFFKLLYQNAPHGLSIKQLAGQMCNGELSGIQRVLNSISRRVALATDADTATPKYQVFFFIEGEGQDRRFRLYPETKQALENITPLLQVIQKYDVEQIYERFPSEDGNGGLAID